MEEEIKIEIGISSVSNLSFLPAIVYSYKYDQGFYFALALSMFFVSSLYHVSECFARGKLDDKIIILGLKTLEWHRLDNLISIFLIQNLFLSFTEFDHVNNKEAFRFFYLTLCIYFQQVDPWNVAFTIIPSAVPAFVMLLKIAIKRKLPNANYKDFTIGITLAFSGLIFFYKGLDEENDYLRIFHSIWHLLSGFALFYFYRARIPSTKFNLS